MQISSTTWQDSSLHEFNEKAYQGVSEAHLAGDVPQIGLRMKKLDVHHIGHLLYFYMHRLCVFRLFIGC